MQGYITIAGRKLAIEITGADAGDIRLAEGEISKQCDDCASDIAESMRWSSRNGKRWIYCWTCRMRYPIERAP